MEGNGRRVTHIRIINKPNDLVAKKFAVVLGRQVGLGGFRAVELEALADALPQNVEGGVGLQEDDEGLPEEEEDNDVPSAGALPYAAVACIPCIGMVALNKQKEIEILHKQGDPVQAVHAAKSAAHIGFLGVVFGTMIWMVVFGLIIKPLIAGEDPCEGYPDCVPDEWLARTLEGSPPE